MDFSGPMYYWCFLCCIRALYIHFILLQWLELIRALSLIKKWILNEILMKIISVGQLCKSLALKLSLIFNTYLFYI